MKKYLFGIAAIVLAISFSAFNTKSVTSTYFFEFKGTVTDAAHVGSESQTYWQEYTGLVEDACNSIANKACIVEVDASNTLASPRRIDPSKVNIVATPGLAGSTVGYIPSNSSTNLVSKTHKQ